MKKLVSITLIFVLLIQIGRAQYPEYTDDGKAHVSIHYEVYENDKHYEDYVYNFNPYRYASGHEIVLTTDNPNNQYGREKITLRITYKNDVKLLPNGNSVYTKFYDVGDDYEGYIDLDLFYAATKTGIKCSSYSVKYQIEKCEEVSTNKYKITGKFHCYKDDGYDSYEIWGTFENIIMKL